jgi:tRNA(fMet)-specific endonuclease VapC
MKCSEGNPMTYYLDSNILIFVLRGMNKGLAEKIDSIYDYEIKIPSVVVAELVEGAYASKDAKRTVEQTMKYLDTFEMIPFDKDAAMIYGRIGAKLRAEGRKIGSNDLMIASTVMSRNGILISNNTKEFNRIDGLRLEDWTEL